MNEIKKIIHKVYLLIIDIFFFGYKTATQIILPARRKKGNLLSTLFIFFIGIIERLDGFEHGVFSMACLLRKRYVKRSLLIVAGLLFVLSSIEWAAEKNFSNPSGNYITRFAGEGAIPAPVDKRRHVIGYPATTCLVKGYPAYKNILHGSGPLSSSVKRFLLIRSIRI